MSLVSLLVAIGISTLVTMGILQVLTQGQQSLRNLASQTELSNTAKLVSIFLENRTACESYVKDLTFNPTPATLQNQKVSGIEITYPSDTTKVFLKAGTTVENGLVIEEVALVDFQENGVDRYSANLRILAKLKQTIIRREIPIGIVTENINATQEKILRCSLRALQATDLVTYRKNSASFGCDTGTVTVSCNAGDIAIGGGGACGNCGVTGRLETSYPLGNPPTGWIIACDENGNGTFDGGQAYVICLKQ